MSTAFRNFIITFALAAALFAVVGYMAVSGFLSGLFQGNGVVSEDVTEYSYENAESYYEGENGTSEEIPSAEEIGDAYLIFFEDHKSELTGAKILCVNEKSGKLVYETLPISSVLTVNGFDRSVKEIYSSNGEEYLCGKLQYVFGLNFKAYLVFNPRSMNELFGHKDFCKNNELNVSCKLPYEIKYEDPEMKEYNKENPDDIQYITLAGDVIITSENAEYIFENVPEDELDSKAASTMFAQIYDSVFSSVFSKNEIRNSAEKQKTFFEFFQKCSFSSENYMVIFGIYDGSYEVSGFSELLSTSGKNLNWSMLPSVLENLLK